MKIRILTIIEISPPWNPAWNAVAVFLDSPITWGDLLKKGRVEIDRVNTSPLGDMRARTVYELSLIHI